MHEEKLLLASLTRDAEALLVHEDYLLHRKQNDEKEAHATNNSSATNSEIHHQEKPSQPPPAAATEDMHVVMLGDRCDEISVS